MPPRKKTAPKGRGANQRASTARQQANAKAREDRITRAARRAEELESIHKVDPKIELD